MIEYKNISKKYGSKEVLRDISLRLEAQKIHVFIGTSGSGKTTLLRILSGLTPPTKGEIRFDNFKNEELKSPTFIKNLGYVVQEGGLFPHMSAKENILLSVHNETDKDYKKHKLKELTALTNLSDDLLNKFPHELSGGQRQRVGIMRALMKSPKLILMDEPLGALDPITRSDLQEDLLKLFNRLKTTVVFVTHDINEASYLGDTVTLLGQGKIIQHGTFKEFINNPQDPFVTKFIKAQTSHFLVEELHGH